MNNKYCSNQGLKTEVFSKQANTYLVTVLVDKNIRNIRHN